jgi:hypothetical protein
VQKRVAIIQSNYIPWKGYFDIIGSVDHFVLYDDMQYTRRDWRNRNQIKSSKGSQWLTIPVEVKGKFSQRICDTVVASKDWAEDHFQSLTHTYSRAPHFSEYLSVLKSTYEAAAKLDRLSDINYLFISMLCQYLGITTTISWSTDLKAEGDKSERLLNICKQLNASEYVSGPAAMSYLNCEIFEQNKIDVSFFDYSNYPEYQQLYPPFSHAVTAIDLLAHLGADAPKYMKYQTLRVT